MFLVHIAALVLQKFSSTKQMLGVGSAPPTLTSFSQMLSLLMDDSWNAFYIHRGWTPCSERTHASTILTPGRSTLNRASGILSLRMVSSHLLPLTSKPIALSLFSDTTKPSWTLSGMSPRIASSKYLTFNSDRTPWAASSTDRAKRNCDCSHLPFINDKLNFPLFFELCWSAYCFFFIVLISMSPLLIHNCLVSQVATFS